MKKPGCPPAVPQGPVPLVVVGHVTKTYGPVQALVGVLKGWGAPFRLLSLPFAGAGIEAASDELFHGAALVARHQGHPATGWVPLLWARDFIYSLRRGWAASRPGRIPLWVGIDCLNALAGLVLRALGRVDRVVFYVIDYSPRRFPGALLNGIYQAVDRSAATRSDEVWNLSERMREVRRRQGVAPSRNRLVPVGVELDKVLHPAPARVRRHSLLYMGALNDNKGIQMAIEAFPEILRRVPDASLHIIGYGPFEAQVRALAAASPARRRIHIPGGMGHDRLFREVPRFGVALAPYLDDPSSYTWWCDPTKPKEYLACGLPLIITKVPWVWERVADERRPLGLAIDYNREQLVVAAVRLLGDDRFYWRCRRNALAFAADLDWNGIYARAFGAKESAA